jgi:hypothetical protein
MPAGTRNDQPVATVDVTQLFLASVLGMGALALSVIDQYRASQTPVVAITPAATPVQAELAAA